MNYFENYFEEATATMRRTSEKVVEIQAVAERVLQIIREGGTIYICGNGGSASDAQHIAAELIGRFKSNRRSLPSVCLNTDTSAITAIANDFGYEEVFARQLEGLASTKDFLLAISTSGNSKNIVEVLKRAKLLGVESLLLTGGTGGIANGLADHVLIVDSVDTCHIQESHIAIGQAICGFVENAFL